MIAGTPTPDSSVVLAYDAARQACVALLAQQGLRPTTAGGHYAVRSRAGSRGGGLDGAAGFPLTVCRFRRWRVGCSGWASQ